MEVLIETAIEAGFLVHGDIVVVVVFFFISFIVVIESRRGYLIVVVLARTVFDEGHAGCWLAVWVERLCRC